AHPAEEEPEVQPQHRGVEQEGGEHAQEVRPDHAGEVPDADHRGEAPAERPHGGVEHEAERGERENNAHNGSAPPAGQAPPPAALRGRRGGWRRAVVTVVRSPTPVSPSRAVPMLPAKSAGLNSSASPSTSLSARSNTRHGAKPGRPANRATLAASRRPTTGCG